MKKLKKLKLKNFSEMNEQEMKYVIGGELSSGVLCGDSSPDKCDGMCSQISGNQVCRQYSSTISGNGHIMTVHHCGCVSGSSSY